MNSSDEEIEQQNEEFIELIDELATENYTTFINDYVLQFLTAKIAGETSEQATSPSPVLHINIQSTTSSTRIESNVC